MHLLKTFKCRHCQVEVVSRDDTRAIPLREHAGNCPRHPNNKPKRKVKR